MLDTAPAAARVSKAIGPAMAIGPVIKPTKRPGRAIGVS